MAKTLPYKMLVRDRDDALLTSTKKKPNAVVHGYSSHEDFAKDVRNNPEHWWREEHNKDGTRHISKYGPENPYVKETSIPENVAYHPGENLTPRKGR